MVCGSPGQIQVQSKRKIHYWSRELCPCTCKVSMHSAAVTMASDLKPPVVHNGILSEGERSLFASESSLRAAKLQCGSWVPAEYFAL